MTVMCSTLSASWQKNNIAPEADPERKKFYYTVAERIVNGYRLPLPMSVHQP
jgi:hypothetical protein